MPGPYAVFPGVFLFCFLLYLFNFRVREQIMTMRHSGLFMVGIVGRFQFQDHIMHVITIDSCFELPL
jgi:hypothetical protein